MLPHMLVTGCLCPLDFVAVECHNMLGWINRDHGEQPLTEDAVRKLIDFLPVLSQFDNQGRCKVKVEFMDDETYDRDGRPYPVPTKYRE